MAEIYFRNKLEMIVSTIGYKKEGESILIQIKCDGSIVYSIIIDGFKVNGCNKTYDLIKENGIEYIDMLCWTHPDEDHSVGLEEYIEFLRDKPKDNSTIIVSSSFYETRTMWENANKKMYNFIENELRKDMKTKKKVSIKQATVGRVLKKITFIDTRTGFEYLFKVSSFAPDDSWKLKRQMEEGKLFNNHISVGICIEIGNFTSVFCADVPDVVFNNIELDEFPRLIDFVKIPHHGSKSSKAIFNRFNGNLEVACTTVNTANGLPNKEVLDEYKKRSNSVYCTNNLEMDEQLHEWGVVETSFSVDCGEIFNNTYGNADIVN